MRIISKKEDYYDFVPKVGGYDPTHIWKRNNRIKDVRTLDYYSDAPARPFKTLERSGVESNLSNSATRIDHNGRISTFWLFIAGKMYRFIEVFSENMRDSTWVSSEEELIEAVKNYYGEDVQIFNASAKDKFSRWRCNQWLYVESKAFDIRDATPEFTEFARNNSFINCGLWVSSNFSSKFYDISENSSVKKKFNFSHDFSGLKDIGMQKIMDPYTLFQELSMWYGSCVMPERNMIEISEKDKINSKGFDKVSFRPGMRSSL